MAQTNIELERFLRENPDQHLLEGCSDKEIIDWAIDNKFISIRYAYTGDRVYTDHDLTVAKMWYEKVGKSDGDE